MLKDSLKGAVIASAVASMFGAVALAPLAAHAADEGKVKCEGGNSCSGKSACSTANNSCAGKNGCKGKGWVWAKNEADCKKMGGKSKK
jgi:hypothetical protein